MKNVWAIACKNSIIDQETNSLSLLESLDRIDIVYQVPLNTKIIKVVPIVFRIVSLWFDINIKKERKFDLLIEIIDSHNKKLKDFKQSIVFPVDKKRLRVMTKINGFGFTSSGVYKIKIKYRSGQKSYQQVSEIPIDINLIEREKKLKK